MAASFESEMLKFDTENVSGFSMGPPGGVLSIWVMISRFGSVSITNRKPKKKSLGPSLLGSSASRGLESESGSEASWGRGENSQG